MCAYDDNNDYFRYAMVQSIHYNPKFQVNMCDYLVAYCD